MMAEPKKGVRHVRRPAGRKLKRVVGYFAFGLLQLGLPALWPFSPTPFTRFFAELGEGQRGGLKPLQHVGNVA